MLVDDFLPGVWQRGTLTLPAFLSGTRHSLLGLRAILSRLNFSVILIFVVNTSLLLHYFLFNIFNRQSEISKLKSNQNQFISMGFWGFGVLGFWV